MTFDIKSLLKSGKTADEIASLFTTELNTAIAEEKKEDKKFNDFLSAFSQITEFCKTYYPDYVVEEDLEKSAKSALKLLDSLFMKKNEKTFFNDFFDFLF